VSCIAVLLRCSNKDAHKQFERGVKIVDELQSTD